jgi:hypothetical protein
MKYLKYALIFFFVVDVSIFLMSQVAPGDARISTGHARLDDLLLQISFPVGQLTR